VRTRVSAAMPFLILLVLHLGFLAGCGGNQSGSGGSQGGEQGGQQQGGGEQQGGQQQGGQQQGGEATDEGPSQEKVALGSIESVKPDRRKIVLKPSFEAQGGDRITFKVRQDAQIQVNDQEADLSDIQQGQQAQIEYVINNEVNRARSVQIVGGGG
jgi:hypothetical protein